MTIIRNIIVAFSMYSRIPMPFIDIKDEDTKYAFGFIGLVGVVIGGLEYALWILADRFQLPVFAETLFWAAVPLLITGGFHVDGFMDVQDAFNSYKPKEEKLKILKDPHIGAFAVISLGILGLLYLGFTYLLLETKNDSMIAISCVGFVLMRALGAFLGQVLPHAKQEGMLHEETKNTKNGAKAILTVFILASGIVMLYLSLAATLVLTAATALYVIWFGKKCSREFGGVSGDTIGFFITEGELIVMCVAAVLSRVAL